MHCTRKKFTTLFEKISIEKNHNIIWSQVRKKSHCKKKCVVQEKWIKEKNGESESRTISIVIQ